MSKMRYFKQFRVPDAPVVEITREKAMWTLEGMWKPEYLEEVFQSKKGFRLFTPYAEVWTQAEDGTIPEEGQWGIVE